MDAQLQQRIAGDARELSLHVLSVWTLQPVLQLRGNATGHVQVVNNKDVTPGSCSFVSGKRGTCTLSSSTAYFCLPENLTLPCGLLVFLVGVGYCRNAASTRRGLSGVLETQAGLFPAPSVTQPTRQLLERFRIRDRGLQPERSI